MKYVTPMLSTNTTASAAATPVSMCRPNHAEVAASRGTAYKSPMEKPITSDAAMSMSDSEASMGKMRVIQRLLTR
jgi:hypothetical protein